jgi:hypothetical protein
MVRQLGQLGPPAVAGDDGVAVGRAPQFFQIFAQKPEGDAVDVTSQ